MGIALFFATFAMRHPKLAAFAKRFWKVGLGIALAIAAYFAFTTWLHHRDAANVHKGFAQAEQQYTDAVNAANALAAKDQKALDQLQQRFNLLAVNREQDIKLTIQPNLERIEREVSENPVYRQCALTDGVWNDLETTRSAVNAGIAPRKP